jgi:Cu/Ag efflux pump CusA
MNKYIFRTSLVWIIVLAAIAGIWAYRSHGIKLPTAMKTPMSEDIQPVASGPPAIADEPKPSMPDMKKDAPLVPVQLTPERMQSIGVQTGTVEFKQLNDDIRATGTVDMYDTTVMIKPREQWPAGMTYEKLIQQMDEKLQFPGLSNTWTSPVENRLDMELTGIKTPLGMKVQGPNVDGIQQLALQLQTVLSGLPQVRSVFAEKVAQGFYVNVDVKREEAARYGLTIADVQTAVSSGIGGQNIAENIEGRERYPINVRYQRDFRDNVDKMRGVLIGTPSGAQIPLGQVA